MNAKNRYYFRSRIREAKFRQLIRCFSMDFTATDTTQLTGISIRSVNTIYLKIRQRIAQNCELESPLQGSVEVDDSYFGAQRVRGKR
ncbi:MAG: IS1595 family transposase, partial [Nitrosomonas sp.]